jgi:hypothetical protein
MKRCPSDPETGQRKPFAPDPVEREIRDAEELSKTELLRQAWDQRMSEYPWPPWSIDDK